MNERTDKPDNYNDQLCRSGSKIRICRCSSWLAALERCTILAPDLWRENQYIRLNLKLSSGLLDGSFSVLNPAMLCYFFLSFKFSSLSSLTLLCIFISLSNCFFHLPPLRSWWRQEIVDMFCWELVEEWETEGSMESRERRVHDRREVMT